MVKSEQERVQSFAFVISVCVAFGLSVAFAFANPPGTAQPSGMWLGEKINPNDAPVASLVRLPGIGLTRAAAIVAYRESCKQADSKSCPFEDCNDLQKVRGIGPKTVRDMSEWLKFE